MEKLVEHKLISSGDQEQKVESYEYDVPQSILRNREEGNRSVKMELAQELKNAGLSLEAISKLINLGI